MTNVASSSREAYTEIKSTGKESNQFERIIKSLAGDKDIAANGITRRELSVRTGMEAGVIAGRCNEMIKRELLVEDETERRKCFFSKKSVKVVRLPIPNAQSELF